MSLDSPHEHADLLAPVADDDGCCGGENRAGGECRGEGRGRGRGRAEGECCGGRGGGTCESEGVEAGLGEAEAKLTEATA